MGIEFRYARIDEYPAISSFLNNYWSKDHIYVRSKPLFDWTFHRSGHWDAQGYSFALAEDKGELVGILGGIPFLFNRFGVGSRGVWIVNYVVRPDRRKGVTALQLLRQFRQPPFDLTVAFGMTQATAPIYQVLRGELLPKIPRHLMVLPHAIDRMTVLLRTAHPDWDHARARSLAEMFQVGALPQQHVQYDRSIPSSWDHREWPSFAGRTIGAARDCSYLTWRYVQHPLFHYRIIAVADSGGRTGLLVWRLETIQRAVEGGRTDVDRFGRLVEFMPASSVNGMDLLTVFFQELMASDAIGADFYGYHAESRAVLESAGFRSTEVHPEGSLLPSRFQPLDGKGGDILSAMFAMPDLPKCSADMSCPWYWTKSDSDQDRPN